MTLSSLATLYYCRSCELNLKPVILPTPIIKTYSTCPVQRAPLQPYPSTLQGPFDAATRALNFLAAPLSPSHRRYCYPYPILAIDQCDNSETESDTDTRLILD